MKLLRQTIRSIILEIYQLDDEQVKRRNKIIDKHGFYYGKKLARAAGLEEPEAQERDRYYLQRYQAELDNPQGKKLKRAFMNGEITILHSMTYEGATSHSRLGGDKDKDALASDWIKSFGK